jgi:hypothetical protein
VNTHVSTQICDAQPPVAGLSLCPSTVLFRVVLRPNYQAEALLGCEAKLPSSGGLG